MTRTTSSRTTGHFAMFHTVSVWSLSPMNAPMALATGPEATSMRPMSATRTRVTSVMSSMMGRSFQIGRPSSIW